MKVTNEWGVPNQFLITDEGKGALGNFIKREVFQSYESVIAIKTFWEDGLKVELDRFYWNSTPTTRKYREKFLNETTKETQAKIDSGEYKLVNLNA